MVCVVLGQNSFKVLSLLEVSVFGFGKKNKCSADKVYFGSTPLYKCLIRLISLN